MTRAHAFCRLDVILAVAMSVTAVAWASYLWGYGTAERAYQAELDRVVLRELVMETEAIRARLGRAPRDQAELESFLGRPMPLVHDESLYFGGGASRSQIHYSRTGDNSFRLQYELWATDDWIYDSTKPAAGWVQHWY